MSAWRAPVIRTLHANIERLCRSVVYDLMAALVFPSSALQGLKD